jgi:hypothetical protein
MIRRSSTQKCPFAKICPPCFHIVPASLIVIYNDCNKGAVTKYVLPRGGGYWDGVWNKFITLKGGYETKFVCFNTKIVLIQFNITAYFMIQIIFHTSLPSLSHKRFDHCSSSLPCSCSLCCDFIPLHELVWKSTWWHKYYSKNYCTAYLIHSVIIVNPKYPK